MYSMTPDCPNNIIPTKRLCEAFKNHLFSLNNDTIKSVSTRFWIEMVEVEMSSSELISANLWKFKLFDEEYEFTLTDRLASLRGEFTDCPLQALYHYSLQVGCGESNDKIIMKRTQLIDTFSKPYFVWFLKAARAPVKIDFLTSMLDYNNNIALNSSYESEEEIPVSNHSECSLVEVIAMMDKNKLNVKSSSRNEFVYTAMNRNLLFKKVWFQTESSYTVAGRPNEHYELQESFLSRYSRRQNGLQLCLSEFVVWYDYSGSSKSEQIFELYDNKLEKIKVSDVETLDNNCKLPEFIISESKSVMIKRKTQNVSRP